MKHNSLHLLFKFHEEAQGEFVGRKTMEEHIQVDRDKGKVVWGHFTSNPNIKGLWDKKMKLIENSLNTYGVAFVFFSDKENELLYVSKYINSYKRAEVEKEHSIVKYIPEYYHRKVGTPKEVIPDELRSYAYVEMSDIKKISFSKLDMIYTDKSDVVERVLDNKGMSSKFYVTLHEQLFSELEDMFKSEQRKGLSDVDFEAILEEEYQVAVENTTHAVESIADEKKDKPDTRILNGRKYYKRDGRVAKRAIISSKYCCEIDFEHKDFTSSVTKENYVEAHHLIPMKYQDEFDFSIDVEANIISLCAACHKKIHHSVYAEKKGVILKLYNERQDRLKDCGIELSLKQLLEYYK